MTHHPKDQSLRIIVTGLIAQYPLGGVAWDYLQYVLGLARLGHDVWYLEDTGQWPYNPLQGGVARDCDFNVRYLADLMDRFGLKDKWGYRFAFQSQCFGMGEAERAALVKSADLLINVSGSLADSAQYRAARRMAYVDSDPVFTQIKLALGRADFRRMIDIHDVHFSFGEDLTQGVPATGHHWRATRQPVVLDQWQRRDPRPNVFTTVMNWTSYQPVVFEGREYGQKDVEFMRFMDLPRRVAPAELEIAVNAGKTRRTPRELLAHRGWRVVDPDQVCPDLDSYRNYIETSCAEWSIAKNGYVQGDAAWFSCRSACYLAAGKPVVVQDTGFSRVLPVGNGILTFRSPDEAVAAIAEVLDNYGHHSRSAREMAETWFDSDKVLGRLVGQAMGDDRD